MPVDEIRKIIKKNNDVKNKYYFHSANINTYSEALWNTKQISKS